MSRMDSCVVLEMCLCPCCCLFVCLLMHMFVHCDKEEHSSCQHHSQSSDHGQLRSSSQEVRCQTQNRGMAVGSSSHSHCISPCASEASWKLPDTGLLVQRLHASHAVSLDERIWIEMLCLKWNSVMLIDHNIRTVYFSRVDSDILKILFYFDLNKTSWSIL